MDDPETRESVLAVAKEMIACGLVEGTAGNVSARLPDGNIVLTPSSVDYETMTLDDLVVTDIEGTVLEGERAPTTEKSLHLACLRKHRDIGAVMHCHALFASMFAVVRQPIPCVIEEFDVYVGGEVPVAAIARNDESLNADELLARCRKELAGYKQPREIRFVGFDELPRSTTGKIQRHEVETWFKAPMDEESGKSE